jgi:radical SAM protein with 4Fe4S-binding SPASM domain
LAVALDPDANGGLSDTQTELSRRNQSDPWLADLQVELTAACNERCLHCYQPLALREKGHADPALVRRVIDEFAAMGGLSFSFSGGECLLHPDFADLLHYARSRDLSVAILSNLTALDDRLLTAIRDARIAQIQVSVYSLRGEEHDHITRAPGSLRRTLDAINRLVAADVPVQVSCPVMRTNHRSYKDVLSWARERSMKAHTDFILMARSDFSKDNLDERLNDEETRDLLRDILAVDRDYTDDITGRDPLDTPDAPVCGVGQGTICMAADGVFYPCSGWQGYAVGDANSQSLAEIWRDSPQLSGLRRLTKASFPACRACEDRDYCAMCLVRNFNESDGDMMRVSKRFCEIARINRQIVEDWKRTRGVPQRVGQP